ncbi:MAG: aminomethyl-transferring glycine dehydrogenase subunit GcvPB [Pseudomonadota bacterium]
MTEFPGGTGLVLNEPLLWEKGKKGRQGLSLPERDVPAAALDPGLAGEGPDFPDLSEVDLVRHYTRLSTWNFGVDLGMYPLGSCTMKYNPKINEKMAALPGLARLHPLLPTEMSQGALKLIHDLARFLCEVTGMDAASVQPAAGAHGELAGMLILKAFDHSRGQSRGKIIVPDTAHGTNPASAALCGFKPVGVSSGEQGILTTEAVAQVMDEDTAGIMVTNPNTLGLFEENLAAVADIVHEKGGLVYCDGANMNAIMGIVHLGRLGVDVMHLNLHKTFSTPHGGGGPGSGPVLVKKALEKFLPLPRVVEENGRYVLAEDFPDSIGRLHSFYGNFGVMIKAYCYILSLGPELKKVSQMAVLNANYVKESLKDIFHLMFDRPCMHECVFSDRRQREHRVSTLDMVKRLMDYGFHPPTIYFPLVVPGAIMVEPTETESKEDLDLFIQAMRDIAAEAEQNPDKLREAPSRTRVSRMDETAAARRPCLTG